MAGAEEDRWGRGREEEGRDSSLVQEVVSTSVNFSSGEVGHLTPWPCVACVGGEWVVGGGWVASGW